jgi:hypothetical protein
MEFRTIHQDLATAIVATKSLRFLGCVPTGRGYRVSFQFADPDHKATELKLQFERGELTAPCNVTLAALRFLRREAEEAQAVQRG